MMLQRLRKSFFYPERKKPAPRTKDTRSGCTDRPAPFSWKHFRKLIDEVRGSEYEQLNDDLFYACKLNVSAQFVKAVIDDAEIGDKKQNWTVILVLFLYIYMTLCILIFVLLFFSLWVPNQNYYKD